MKKPASAQQASSNHASSGVEPQLKRARGKQPDPEKKADDDDDETKKEEGEEEEEEEAVDRATLRNRRTSAAYHTTRDKYKPKVSKGDKKGTAQWQKNGH